MNNLYLCHHGITGQKWGVRRYQNKDGSLTPEGRKRLLGAGSKTRKKFGEAYERYKDAQKVYEKSGKLSDKLKREQMLNRANAYLSSLHSQLELQSAIRFDGASLMALDRGNDWVDAFMEDYRKYGAD